MILRDYWFCWVCLCRQFLLERVADLVIEDLEHRI